MGSEEQRGPRVGCGAAVRDGRGWLLLVQRGRPPEQGCWGLPGGKVDWMETVEDAVVREVREETGLQVRLRRLLCVVDHREPALGQHWVAPVYEAEPVDPSAQAAIQEPDVLTGLDWFPIEALPRPLTAATRHLLALMAPSRINDRVAPA